MERQTLAQLRRFLKDLTPAERDALRRFYELNQTAAEIKSATGLTQGQLTRLKTRIKKASAKKK